MNIQKIVTYKTDGKEFDCPEKAEAYLLDKVQAELHNRIKPVYNKHWTFASLSYHLILELVGTPENLKKTLETLNIYSEFPKEEEEEE